MRQKSLKDESKWDELITIYQGNSAWLNIIASSILELDNGKVSNFLADQDELFLGDIETILGSHLERLSELEIQVINWLATQDQPVNICQKYPDFELSQTKFKQVIQSLIRRCLLEKISQEEECYFQLNYVFKEYINQLTKPVL